VAYRSASCVDVRLLATSYDNTLSDALVAFGAPFVTNGDWMYFTAAVTENHGGRLCAISDVFTAPAAAVPEPSTFALLGLSAIGFGIRRFRRRKTA